MSAMIARLRELDEARAASRAARQSAAAEARDERENAAAVAAMVDAERGRVRGLLARARAAAAAEEEVQEEEDGAEAAGRRGAAEAIIAEAIARTAEMESTLSSCSYFLPAYDSKSLQAVISSCKRDVADAKAELVPRRKFKFRFFEALEAAGEEGGAPVPTPDAAGAREAAEGAAGAGAAGPHASNRISDRADEEIVLSRADLGGGGDLVSLSGLTRCAVYITGPTAGVYLHRLDACTVFAGPTSGAVHVEEATGCTFALASHQLRIHTTTGCDFMLRVRSGPIIEHTAGVRVAPYVFRYEGIGADMAAAGLGEEELRAGGLEDSWSRVEDFGWVRLTKSPNWRIMPEAERPAAVDRSAAAPAAVDRAETRVGDAELCSAAAGLALEGAAAGAGAPAADADDAESDDEL